MDSPALPPATVVGDEFAKLYYFLLQHKPEEVSLVYKDSSKIGRPGNDGNMCHYTLSDIDENLNVLSSGGFNSVEVTSVGSLDSMDGGVFVNVTGYFTLDERVKRSFMQLFFLAPQEPGYFVLNDMFRFDDEPIPPTNTNGLTESSAVHLKNLPANYTIDSIENALTEFGAIRRGGTEVFVRTYYYGTVEFEDVEAAQRALEASPVTICGKKVGVEKKNRFAYTSSVDHKRIHHEEEGLQENQHIDESDQERRTIVVDELWFQNWLKTMEERSKMKKEEKRIVVVDESWFQNLLKTMEERTSKEEREVLEDFKEWQRSIEKESKLKEESGETHSWDYDVVMEEHKKFMEETQSRPRRRKREGKRKPKVNLTNHVDT